MGRPKRWYDPEASVSVRVVGRDDPNESYCSIRWRHPRVDPTLWECLRYPLTDGPGLGLLFFFPPLLWVLSLPIFDIIAVLQPLKSDWRLGLMVVPVMIPDHLQLPHDLWIRDRLPWACAGGKLAR